MVFQPFVDVALAPRSQGTECLPNEQLNSRLLFEEDAGDVVVCNYYSAISSGTLAVMLLGDVEVVFVSHLFMM